jgi:hypothetical protein
MPRTAFYAPAHRVMGRVPPGSGAAAQPSWIAPSMDAVGHGIQDARWPWNQGSNAAVPNVVGWYDPGCHPVLDVVPATLGVVSLAAAQAPVAGTALTLVSATGAGITVSSSATYMLPSGNTIAAGSLFSDGVTVYRTFGLTSGSNEYSNTVCYDAATMLGRAVAIRSLGDDSSATFVVAGYDIYGYPQSETITGSSGAPGTANGKKPFKVVTSITPAGTLSGSNVSAGMSDIFGLPILATAQSALVGYWNNLILYNTGTFAAGVLTSPATATTGDVRGTWVPASASDGSKRLTLFQRPSLSQMITSGINIGMFGVTPYTA